MTEKTPELFIPVPYVIKKTLQGERSYDIYSRLLEDRIIWLGTPIDATVGNLIAAQLLFLDQDNETKEISLYINSPGGYISDGLAIVDTMAFIHAPVATYCLGMAASMAAVILACGAKGLRSITPNSQVMIHQPTGGARGQASDIAISAEHMRKTRIRLNRILSEKTGQPLEKIIQDTDRDHYLDAEEAVAYGLVDEILMRKPGK